MSIQKHICLTIAGLLLMVLMSGCQLITNYGKLRLQYGPDEKMTIQRLEERWQDYDVYYAGVHVQLPSAVIFDPKDDDRKLITHERWVHIEDREELAEVLLWLWGDETSPEFSPQLWKILGPDDQLYGYMYTPWDHANIKMVDEKTLWVDDIPLPPISTGADVMIAISAR